MCAVSFVKNAAGKDVAIMDGFTFNLASRHFTTLHWTCTRNNICRASDIRSELVGKGSGNPQRFYLQPQQPAPEDASLEMHQEQNVQGQNHHHQHWTPSNCTSTE
ncbi:uncharacterized protein LOC132902197 [Amyelois transitella]|uniref:uncharacterized protein LOC132902197 n=1 Tax=Amyelois transitella TaxID=680683 RepID=UPI002990698D|nr:uncharacterized protein LOC132902197 [Amyelois transitella]